MYGKKKKYNMGGKLKGMSHSKGGIPIEAEGGEFIIKKDSVNPKTQKTLEYINDFGNLPESNAQDRTETSYMGGGMVKPMYKDGGKVQKKSPAWQRAEGKSKSGGLNKKGIASYRKDNPGSKLSMAVTTKPSKLKKGSKSAKRRKSFCARMKGMRKRQKSSNNTGKDRLSLSLKKWNC